MKVISRKEALKTSMKILTDAEKERKEIFTEFMNKIITSQQDCPPEYEKVVSENFWELI